MGVQESGDIKHMNLYVLYNLYVRIKSYNLYKHIKAYDLYKHINHITYIRGSTLWKFVKSGYYQHLLVL